MTQGSVQVPAAWCVGAALALALGLASCVTPVAPRGVLPQEVATALWDGWRERVADRSALRCVARLAVDGEGTRLRSKQRMALELPARLRVEIQGFLGTTVGVLTVDDSEYAFLQAEPRLFERGPVDDALLARVVSVALPPATVVELLLGRPEREEPLAVLNGFEVEDGLREVQLERQRAARFDAQGRLQAYRVGVEAPDTGSPTWEATFEDYALVDGAPVAHRVTLLVGNDSRAILILRDVELNPTLSPDIFRLDGHGPVAGRFGVEGG